LLSVPKKEKKKGSVTDETNETNAIQEQELKQEQERI
jgi:hypothetical protein